jgi:hypothetical protein
VASFRKPERLKIARSASSARSVGCTP